MFNRSRGKRYSDTSQGYLNLWFAGMNGFKRKNFQQMYLFYAILWSTHIVNKWNQLSPNLKGWCSRHIQTSQVKSLHITRDFGWVRRCFPAEDKGTLPSNSINIPRVFLRRNLGSFSWPQIFYDPILWWVPKGFVNWTPLNRKRLQKNGGALLDVDLKKHMSFMMKGDGATLPISLRETLELEWWTKNSLVESSCSLKVAIWCNFPCGMG